MAFVIICGGNVQSQLNSDGFFLIPAGTGFSPIRAVKVWSGRAQAPPLMGPGQPAPPILCDISVGWYSALFADNTADCGVLAVQKALLDKGQNSHSVSCSVFFRAFVTKSLVIINVATYEIPWDGQCMCSTVQCSGWIIWDRPQFVWQLIGWMH